MRLFRPALLVVLFFLSCLPFALVSQNQASKWYFGNQAGLDFMSSPPAIIQGSMNAPDGCASISDAAGNLLFYTNGQQIWNASHQVMANGSSITGNMNVGQNSVIVKQPGSSNLYHVFSCGWNTGLYYSTVDMSLAAGLGSVTVLNVQLVTGAPNNNNYYYVDRVTATRHCNGNDVWVVAKDSWWNNNNLNNSQNFYSFLVTAAGVNTTAVVSAAGTWSNNGGYSYGCMKISPNGTKIGLSSSYWNNVNNQQWGLFELWDFNSGTGAVTNSLSIGNVNWNLNNWWWGYGCEFSPDGSKFYGTVPYGNNNNINTGYISQWDLCAGSPTAIVASEYTVAQNINNNQNIWSYPYAMQLAPNGKIYVARWYQTAIDVINNPNASGVSCMYTPTAQSIGTRTCYTGLPNFMTSYLSQTPPLPPFTYTVNNTTSCLTVSFTAPSNPTFACAAQGYSVNGVSWNFGDPASGAANTATSTTPTHTYPVPGTYTTVLSFLNACGSTTIALPVVINGASLTINTASITCANLGSATVSASGGVGPFSFTWMPTAQTTSVATGLIPGNYSITVVDNGGNCAYTSTVGFAPLVPLTGVVNNAPAIPCNGIGTGTANITLAGGSGGYNYFWNNGVTVQTTPTVNNLAGGIHTVTVIDALTSCSVMQTFFINQPPALGLVVGTSNATVCAGGTVTLTALSSGGTPGSNPAYTYSWTGGPTTVSRTATQAIPGNYTYSVTSRDGNNCPITGAVQVGFIVNPTVSVASTSICPLQTATLTATGASSYTWQPSGNTGNTLNDTPAANTSYTVIGSALGCTSAPKSATVYIKPLPSPTITSNSPVCNGQALNMSSNSGSAYQWNGPLSFSSFVQSPTINPASPARSGVYSLTLTGLNSCTATTTTTLTVHPTPTISLAGSTVCVTQTLNLTANSFAGATYSWTGPVSFTSSAQNPSINPLATNMSGTYNLTVTSVQGCTNTAQTSASVVAMPVPTISSSANALCLGSSLSFTGSGGGLYSWSGPNAFASAVSNPGISNIQLAANGVYTLVVTVGPCVTSTTKSITVFPLPVAAANSAPTCDGKNLYLTASGGVAYSWSGPNIYTSSLQNPVLSPCTPTQSGLYTVLVTDANGCQSTANTQVVVLLNPQVLATGATVCYGNPAVLTASGAVSYTWTGPSGYNSYMQNAPVASATNLQAQVYTVTGSAPNSCTSTTTASLKTIPLPVPAATITSRACLNSVISVSATGGDRYEWQGPYVFYANQPNATFVAGNMAYSGIYTLTAFSNAGCQARTTVSLQLDPAPEGDLENTIGNSCVPFCAEFGLRPRNAVPISNMLWYVNGQQYSSPTFSYCMTNPGTYQIIGTFTNAIGCVNSSSFTIAGYALPVADFEFSPEIPIENFDQVSFVSTSSGQQINNWSWYFADNTTGKFSGPAVNYQFDKAGSYPVALVVKNSWGCSDTVVKTILVDSDFNVYVPSAFTPNADDLNDVFLAKGVGVVKFNLNVYNRWGELLFQSNDMAKGWDGSFRGQECKADVYAWKLKATDAKGRSRDLEGHVTLYR